MDKRLPEYIFLIQKCSRVRGNNRKWILPSPNKVLPFPCPWGCDILIIPKVMGAGTACPGEGFTCVFTVEKNMEQEGEGDAKLPSLAAAASRHILK